MNAQERVARILCRLTDDEWQLGETLYRMTADEILSAVGHDDLVAALRSAEACISGTLLARGYQPGSSTDEWAPEVQREVRAIAVVRTALAKAEAA